MTLSVQFLTMLSMVGSGCFIGVSLDTYSRFLMRSKRAKWIVFINDVFFWLFQGLLLFYVLLQVNEGEFRVYILLALLCGYAAYQSLLKKMYLAVLEWMIRFTVGLYRTALRIGDFMLVKPVTGLTKLLIAIVTGLVIFLWKLVKWLCRLIFGTFKVLMAPVIWILKGMLKLVPARIRKFFHIYFKKAAGFCLKILNMCGNLWILRKKKK
ncbi:spore cortex biosynthesis protein YabQ [Metabacillus sp. JX24]|uniref:spore cortex biosynthesis protein YabQ n=1 Tax=Metabacillus sp. JX24 TaxID=3240759 RepID=UPI00350F5018